MMATETDMLHRRSLIRKDTPERQGKVTAAREFIYEGQYVVDAAQVERLLKDESLVPTEVRAGISHNGARALTSRAERLFDRALCLKFRFLSYAGCRPLTRVRAWGLESDFHPLAANARQC